MILGWVLCHEKPNHYFRALGFRGFRVLGLGFKGLGFRVIPRVSWEKGALFGSKVGIIRAPKP